MASTTALRQQTKFTFTFAGCPHRDSRRART